TGHAKAVIDLETSLAKASLTRVEKRDPHNLHHLLKLSEMVTANPRFDWAAYFKALGLPGTTEANVTEPKFFAELDARLGDVPLPGWKSYLKWHLARTRSQYLSKAFADPYFEFFAKYLRGVAEQPPRWKKCVDWV